MIGAALTFGWYSIGEEPLRAQESPTRPNIVLVVVDDLRWDEFGAAGHAYLQTPNIDRVAAEGVTFTNTYNTTPLCSPNRASILTGQYASRHGVLDNSARNRASHRLQTFARELQRSGYETAHVGKWHMGNDPTPRPGYDYWVSLPGQGRTIDPELYEDGRLHTVEGYVTDILTDRAVSFIRRKRQAPFFLYLGHKAIHPDAIQLDDGSVDLAYGSRFIPADRHRGMYEEAVFPRRPNAAPAAIERSNNPAVRQALELKQSPEMVEEFAAFLDPNTSEENIRRRGEMLMAVDEGLGRLRDALDEMGVLNNTMIIFTSDNGYFYGEHGFSIERRLPYEETARAPLLIQYPPLARAGSKVDAFALSIDLAPTALDVAQASIGDHIQGRSLVPLLRGDTADWRTSFLIEYISHENPMPWLMGMGYRAVRSGRYKYISWIHRQGMDELYDLESDPYELTNVIGEPRMQGIVRDVRNELGQLVLEAMGLSP
jgi:N-acetylglucosamine-6-sulfatase